MAWWGVAMIGAGMFLLGFTVAILLATSAAASRCAECFKKAGLGG